MADKTPREKIIEEFMHRLERKFNHVPIERGTMMAEASPPYIYVFEDRITVELHKRGQYIKVLPITVEYIHRCDRAKNVFKEGGEKLLEVRTAIETDEWVNQQGTTDNLVIDFKQTGEDIIPYPEGVVDVITNYEVKFVEAFLGTLAY